MIPAPMTAFEAYCQMTDNSSWLLKSAFWLRDRISSLAGVKSIGGFVGSRPETPPQTGGKLDFFDVLSISEDKLFLSSNDRHLSVLAAIMLDSPVASARKLTITTSVKTHNFFGTLYMLPVAPAHEVIVQRMLEKVKCEPEAKG